MTKEFVTICREHGLKVTQQRLEIYRALLEIGGHPSVETVHRRLRDSMPTLSLDTVYRTLTTFEKLGLVRRVETVTREARFEIRSEPHHHFFCERCGQLIDFPWESFDRMDLPRAVDSLGRISERHVVVQGTCQRCLGED